ncbi:hypothetical protein PMAYCL1PPCAC_26929, partial [Pristionchus mayeri]
YRFLLIAFATTDILVSLAHVTLMPGVQMTSAGYIFFGYHLIDKPLIWGTTFGILFVIFFYQSFILLAFHFFYRYTSVC